MTETSHRQELSLILRNLAQELDVPPSKYEEAKDHYDAVGAWLGDDDSALARYALLIYAQGSFALGTAVRPRGDDDYDVDAVCLLQLKEGQVSQEQLKDLVGDRLKHRGSIYRGMLDPPEGGRRCWTIKYADASKFHLDVLPSIPDEYGWLVRLGVPGEWAKHAICITDRDSWDNGLPWPKSNPKGYAEWFKNRMLVTLEEGRRILAAERKAEVQEIEDYEVRTPLQRVVQLLKRHRDERYNGDDDKPISIIITTLAGLAYDNEADLVDAVLNVVPGMREGIEQRDGVFWVPNPVNPLENFADKWAETPRKAEIFFQWVDAVEQEHGNLLTARGFAKVGDYLAEAYGKRDAAAAMAKYGSTTRAKGGAGASATAGIVRRHPARLSRFDVPHRQAPRWAKTSRYSVTVTAELRQGGLGPRSLRSNSEPVPKGCSLRFTGTTTAPSPYTVYWQVVNTGAEAEDAGDLRGGFYGGELDRGELTWRKETTKYSGQHWIECFIVKDNALVARSGEFVVNIQ